MSTSPVLQETHINPRTTIPRPGVLYVMRRDNKTLVPFNPDKVKIAITKAYLAVEGDNAAVSRRVHEVVDELTDQVTKIVSRYLNTGGIIRVEEVQDQIELTLMRAEHHKVARTYILYREERRLARESKKNNIPTDHALHITLDNGERVLLDETLLSRRIETACHDLNEVDAHLILDETLRNIFDGVHIKDLHKALIMAARTKIELEPNYSYLAARLLLDDLHHEALQFLALPMYENSQEKNTLYPQAFQKFIDTGVELQLLSHELQDFDLTRLGMALQPSRDFQFTYLGPANTLRSLFLASWKYSF